MPWRIEDEGQAGDVAERAEQYFATLPELEGAEQQARFLARPLVACVLAGYSGTAQVRVEASAEIIKTAAGAGARVTVAIQPLFPEEDEPVTKVADF